MSDPATPPLPTNRAWLPWVLLMGGVALTASSYLACPRQPATLTAIEGLAPEMARHLSRDSDAEFGAYCRSTGYQRCVIAAEALKNALAIALERGDRLRSDRLARAAKRLATQFERQHHQKAYSWTIEFLSSRSPDQLETRSRLLSVWLATVTLPLAPLPVRVQRADSIVQGLRRIGDDGSILRVAEQLYRWKQEQGRLDDAWGVAQDALARARKIGDPWAISDLLGYLGFLEDDPDRTLDYYLQSLETARRADLPFQAARMAHFLMAFYRARGR